jgi:hypothetical protein
MALTAVSTSTRGSCKCTLGTLSGGDDAFTFDRNMVRYWFGTPAAAVTFYPADSSTNTGGLVIGVPSAVIGPFPSMGLGGRIGTINRTAAQISSVMEELSTGVVP